MTKVTFVLTICVMFFTFSDGEECLDFVALDISKEASGDCFISIRQMEYVWFYVVHKFYSVFICVFFKKWYLISAT
jgi:hypothetical protein